MNQTRQHSGQLAPLNQQVVRPFDADGQATLLQAFRHGRHDRTELMLQEMNSRIQTVTKMILNVKKTIIVI